MKKLDVLGFRLEKMGDDTKAELVLELKK